MLPVLVSVYTAQCKVNRGSVHNPHHREQDPLFETSASAQSQNTFPTIPYFFTTKPLIGL